MDKDIAIKIDGVAKRYEIGKQKDNSLRGTLSNLFKSSHASKDKFLALNEVSFEVKKGDVVGIIGKNGAGKSTLLKILSQITKPTEGRIAINGRIASLLEVGTGFHPELTGRENIYLNGTILGMTRKEVKAKFDEIVAFSGIEKFIDTPVKHYSSGMYVRLAFSVAAHLEPEILVIDEVLAVGDAEFQKKCLGKMQDVANEGRTVLFVSHNMGAVASLCNKCIVLRKGKVQFTGDVQKAIDIYLNENSSSSFYELKENTKKKPNVIKLMKSVNTEMSEAHEFETSKKIRLLIEFQMEEYFPGIQLGVAVLDKYKNKVFTNHINLNENSTRKIIYEIPENTLCPGNYSFDAAIFAPNAGVNDYVEDVCEIGIIDGGSEMYQYKDFGSVFVKCSWNELD